MEKMIQTDRSELTLYNDFIDEDLQEALIKEITPISGLVVNPSFVMYGKPAVMHRTIGFVSDEVDGYPYSGQVMKSISFQNLPELKKILTHVNEYLGVNFNGILINIYSDGHSYIGPHSDDENTLSGDMVVGLSLGASRIFRVKGKCDKFKKDILTQSGQLLIMKGDFQKEFTHEIPKQLRIKESRISLTFRRHQ